MFKTTYKSGLLSIFSSCGSNPLQLWQVEVKNGHVRRMTDEAIGSLVLEIVGCNASTTYIIAPKGTKGLGITLPYMVMLVKNLKKPFTFEVTVIDDSGLRRRIRVSTFISKTHIQPMSTSMPIVLHAGWNKVQVNLAEYTSRSFHTQLVEVANVKVNANIRLRRIYFTESLLSEDELPHDYRLYKPTPSVMKKAGLKEQNKENKQQQTIDSNANEIKGRKVSVKLESKTVVPKIEKEEVTQTEVAPTEGDVKVKPEAADEQEISNKEDTVIEEVALENESPVTEEETAPEEGEKPVAVDTALSSELTEPATSELTEPSQPGEPIAVDEATP